VGKPYQKGKEFSQQISAKRSKGETRRLNALPDSHGGETFLEVCEPSGRPSKDSTGENCEKISMLKILNLQVVPPKVAQVKTLRKFAR
jgi:hypothetical protein